MESNLSNVVHALDYLLTELVVNGAFPGNSRLNPAIAHAIKRLAEYRGVDETNCVPGCEWQVRRNLEDSEALDFDEDIPEGKIQ